MTSSVSLYSNTNWNNVSHVPLHWGKMRLVNSGGAYDTGYFIINFNTVAFFLVHNAYNPSFGVIILYIIVGLIMNSINCGCIYNGF